ncbi:hypothetical protein O3Q51_16195 [Cryomorphaceae bacterium 1068]|nr:hypothetical protein [Cryomorphaceae bacterium 1068]
MNKVTRFFLTLTFISVASIGTVHAQSNWEGGIRFGDRWSADFTVPMQSVRFHPSVYFDRFGIGGYFDWMYALSDGPSGLKFYPGLGPEVFFGKKVDVAIAGNFGAEYSFDFPLTIGFDWRPGFTLTNDFKWKSSNWGIMARYRFGAGSKLVRTN